MSKSLRKAVMTRSRLKNRFNKTNWSKHKKQRKFFISSVPNTKREYFSNLNVKNGSNNKTFW